MGNYKNINHDFIDRTMKLITQYEGILMKSEFEFQNQYNYTLLINCLLGIIILPKEKFYSHIPNPRINNELKKNMGLENTIINKRIFTLRDLMIELRHSIAHFDIKISSNDDDFLIDYIEFNDDNGFVAKFKSNELLPFLRYYTDWIKTNLIKNTF
jgi:hypothetical protein